MLRRVSDKGLSILSWCALFRNLPIIILSLSALISAKEKDLRVLDSLMKTLSGRTNLKRQGKPVLINFLRNPLWTKVNERGIFVKATRLQHFLVMVRDLARVSISAE